VFPTVAAIGGLPPPQDVDGVDISALLAPSSAMGAAPPKLDAAFHRESAICHNKALCVRVRVRVCVSAG
jgi:hypothetical protein